jgi:cytochrome c-type biogenesis protein CcmF
MDYIGEHRLPGQLGHFFIVLSLVASLVATFSFFKASRSSIQEAPYWKKLARSAFITESISVLAIFSILFYIIQNHLFEYKYAWQHSSRSLEMKYLLSCFWEGQEGSFLLWSLWHCVLGLIVIKTGKNWEAPVMTVVSFAQFCLATMVAGIYIFGEKVGVNPFILLRDSGVLDNAPGLHINMDINNPLRPDYLQQLGDGNGLNPLLQNYWMVIHPPVLFLGFASTLIPFSYAIAGLWTGRSEWTKPALPWSLFSAGVLGIGIMMGAAWAYESLTFGGYWAWDPVENASLVPWLILIAGIHTLLIYKHSGYSLRSTYLFFILSFFFILYSTFLTRSGILGDASVHAFTDLGMNGQLFLFMFAFTWPVSILIAKSRNERITLTAITALLIAAIVLAYKFGDKTATSPLFAILAFLSVLAGIGALIYQLNRQVPAIKKEEDASSREFWMFIGSLVFFLSAIVITIKTSLPVFNKTFGFRFAAPEDGEYSYNQIQVFVAIIIAILTAITQYLRYKKTQGKFFWKGIAIPTLISIVVASLVLLFGDVKYYNHGAGFLAAIWAALAVSIYAAIANFSYIWIGLKGKLKLSGGSIAHFGFGLVLVGILLSSSKKEILSYNTTGIPINFGTDSKEKTGENLTLIKGLPAKMGKFDVTYVNDSMHPKKELWYYQIHFKSREDNEEFTLYPNAFVNYKGNENLMANPDSRHYWDHDVFTYVSALPNPDKIRDTTRFKSKTMVPGDSLFYSRGFAVLQDVETVSGDSLPKELFGNDGRVYKASLKVFSKTGSIYTITPTLAYVKGQFIPVPDTLPGERLILQLQNAGPGKSVGLGYRESEAVMKFVTLKAYKFPFINILWLGILITATGIFISMVRRIRLNRLTADKLSFADKADDIN